MEWLIASGPCNRFYRRTAHTLSALSLFSRPPGKAIAFGPADIPALGQTVPLLTGWYLPANGVMPEIPWRQGITNRPKSPVRSPGFAF